MPKWCLWHLVLQKSRNQGAELAGAIDYVINFRELKEIFDALNIAWKSFLPMMWIMLPWAAGLYARTGGVSFSVKTVVNRLEPRRVIKLKAKKVDGAREV
jgi:iron only hydrogenase large subunit-like protein